MSVFKTPTTNTLHIIDTISCYMILVIKIFVIDETERAFMLNGLNNNSASLVLDATIKINSDYKKPWNEMTCAEKLLKILTLGLWNPKYSQDERQQFQGLLTVLEPVSPAHNELGRVYAKFSDGSSLRISVTNSELIEAEIHTPNNEKFLVLLEANEQNRLLQSLPINRHMPYIQVHHTLPQEELTDLLSMHKLLSFTSKLSATLIPHNNQTDPLSGLTPFSTVFMDTSRGLGNSKLSLNGVDIPADAQKLLRNTLGLKDTNSSPDLNVIRNGIPRHYAEQIVKESSSTNEQKAAVVDFLCQPEAPTAICSAFYQSFNVPALMLTHVRISQASAYNAQRSLDMPNACINISITQSSEGSIHVTSHTGVLIMAPEDRPNQLGMLTNRTSYEVPPGVKCEPNEMARMLKAKYASSETYLNNA